MGKSYKKKQQHTRREGPGSVRKDKENNPGLHKKGKIWVDDSDSGDDGDDLAPDDDEDERWQAWQGCEGCTLGYCDPARDEGQSIFVDSVRSASLCQKTRELEYKGEIEDQDPGIPENKARGPDYLYGQT
jgi:hypothetical protein